MLGQDHTPRRFYKGSHNNQMSTTTNLGITHLTSGLKQPEIPVNDAFDDLDAITAGMLSKSVAGNTNVNLTRAEALNQYFKLTGALTGNIEVRFPASGGGPRVIHVHNNTSGAFTLTLTVAGGSGVAITQGERRSFAIDGLSVVALNTGTIGTYTAVSAQAIGARVFHNTTQSIPNNASTLVNFNSERFDTDTIHDTVTNNSRLTCKTAGVYLIVGHLGYAANGTGERVAQILLNGTTAIVTESGVPTSSNQFRLTATTVYSLALNDFVQLVAYQTSGGALNTEAGGNYSPEFMMIRLGG